MVFWLARVKCMILIWMILTDGTPFVLSMSEKSTSILRCEYILYRGLYRTSYARVSRGIITDTELQIGQFVLPKHGHSITDDTVAAKYIRTRKEDLPEDHVRFLLFCSSIVIRHSSVVPYGILWERRRRRSEWSFLPCVQYSM